jgi:hypothetical protein
LPESLLTILKFCLLALMWLFFLRVLRAVWAELNAPAANASAGAAPATVATSAPAAAPASAAPAPPAGALGHLKIVDPADHRGTTFTLGEELTLGRAAGCHVSLPDDTYVSQLHARLFRRDGGLFLEDLGSTNGTFLNRKPVSGATALRRGDRIQVGRTVLEVTK